MRILIIGMPGAGNLGDDLISSVLVNELGKVNSSNEDTEIAILSYGNKNFFEYNTSVNALQYPGRSSLVEYIKRRESISAFLKEVDLIIIGGGGLLQDSHSYFTIHKYFKYLFYPSALNKSSVLLGIGVGPLNYWFTRFYLKLTAPRIGAAFLRDKESEELSRSFFPKATIVPDIVEGSNVAAFGFVEREKRDNVLGCSIRPWKGLDINGIASLIADICLRYKYNCALFVFEYTEQNKEEYDFAQEIKKRLSLKNIATKILTYGLTPIDELVSDFCSVKKAVAIRYHANILWQKVKVKVLPISYAPKVTSFYKKMGINAVEIKSIDAVSKIDISEENFYLIPVDENIDLRDVIKNDNKGKATIPSRTMVAFVSMADHLYGIMYSLKIRVLK